MKHEINYQFQEWN